MITRQPNRLTLHAVISGRVQGVCYRSATQKKAKELRLAGWVKNLQDGRVEVLACGEKKQIEEFESYLWKGPLFAKVSHISFEHPPPSETEKFNEFEILY